MIRKSLSFFALAAAAAATAVALAPASRAADQPNIVVMFCDDLGYGDLSCFGHPTIKTPNLDRLAAEGQKWTSFYVAASVCTPSRAGIMTGRLPIRSGMCSGKRRVLFPDSKGGLPASEITMAAALKKAGYATACVGKWHLGHLPQYLPTSHGFDSYFGIPYSNDMDRVGKGNGRQLLMEPKNEYWNVPLLRGEEVIERPPQQADLTRRYTEEAIKFIDANKEKPFFLYLAHSMPHVPLFASDKFRGTSTRGLYGDVIEEIDWSAGQITGALRERGLDKNTLFVFTSDNGPWLIFNQHGGTAGLLREGKGCTFEGGMREPTIFWWPGKVAPGIQHGMGSTLDLFPTAMALAGAEMPGDREYDGYDLSGALLGGEESPRDRMFYYWGTELYAARLGDWKAHFTTYVEYVGQKHQKHETPLLYNVAEDPGERFDRAKDYPDVIAKIAAAAEAHKATVKPVENQLERR